jgi:hypothetical protein
MRLALAPWCSGLMLTVACAGGAGAATTAPNSATGEADEQAAGGSGSGGAPFVSVTAPAQQPAVAGPVELAKSQGDPYRLCVALKRLVWIEWSPAHDKKRVQSVWSVAKGGGPPRRISDLPSLTTDMTCDDDAVYVIEANESTLVRIADNGDARVMLKSHDYIYEPAVDDQFIYWIQERGRFSLLRMPKGGGKSVVLARGIEGPGTSSLLLDEQFVYWFDGGGSVFRTLKSGGAVEQLSDIGKMIYQMYPRMAASATDIYVGDTQSPGDTSDSSPGRVFRLSKSSSGTGTLAVAGISYLKCLAADASAVYWGSNTHVQRMSTSGSTPIDLAIEDAGVIAMDADETGLYWLTGSSIKALFK